MCLHVYGDKIAGHVAEEGFKFTVLLMVANGGERNVLELCYHEKGNSTIALDKELVGRRKPFEEPKW